ncbi:MvaI/BcnI family restriction endonuclease [Gilvimarinus sp. 1_MG-2023]|uniref:MvaI/BcnI family restriction endonuclease n=1 Tax=Gilvimarinus sp. 1_MG-2023 TaxID=3062638 RepID=UPI0026E41F3D|nr:MvaI/BcnI family restriction endonuclease [Gilvimarinus sp. 1_MG-2023]MDO6748048.1 MvaI/BcnI family restriction endonuclease [Gilvimarinus sp. 1_MG-2023]
MADQPPLTERKIKRYKQAAKKLKNETNCTHAQALDYVVREAGFSSWKELLKKAEEHKQSEFQSLHIDLAEDTKRNDTTSEINNLTELNRRFLAKEGIAFSAFFPTPTGLKKSILDATQQIRTHFLLESFHNYDDQPQGPNHKILKDAFFVYDDRIQGTTMSLYRPITKNGDPRMWFRELNHFCNAGDLIAIVLIDGTPHLFNLAQQDLSSGFETDCAIRHALLKYLESSQDTVNELLGKLRQLAKAPLKAIGHGNTTIGMTIEAALGVDPNSSKLPDYKGIELKSGRSPKNRSTLFAQVPDWSKSQCKSSAEILKKYGYQREDDYKLYCTISARKANSQGLYFKYSDSKDELTEVHTSGQNVAAWSGEVLRRRLKEKHSETFWIHATTRIVNGEEYFNLETITHTKTPIISQLMPLIEDGTITMDHLIKRSGKLKPRVTEKGPLFKINKRDLPLLFPEPREYQLVDRREHHT